MNETQLRLIRALRIATKAASDSRDPGQVHGVNECIDALAIEFFFPGLIDHVWSNDTSH